MLTKELKTNLKQLLPNQIFDDPLTLEKHSGNQFYALSHLPDAVCFAQSEKDVLRIVQFCIEHTIPLIPYGSGTSVEGHLSPLHGGVSLNMSKMDRVLEFNPDDGYVVVETGIAYNQLNDYLDQYGFHFPVEAGWGASIGGMISTNAAGAGALDAGPMLRNIVDMKVVVYDELHQAKLIKVGTRALKSSAGYHLDCLFVGAEGTLGVITQASLKIRKNFPFTNTICCQFDSVAEAVQFVIAMKPLIRLRRVEFLDKLQTTACINYANIDFLSADKNTVMIEIAGNELELSAEKTILLDYLNANNASHIRYFPDKKSAQDLWMMRKNACPAAIQYLAPHKKAIATDISVPLSKLAVCLEACYAEMHLHTINAPVIAHLGDGNFHFTILIDGEDSLEVKRAKEFYDKIVELALKFQGTCTGEHGIGSGKKEFLKKEHGDSLFLMKSLKKMFDPLNIFNPGKIVD